MKIKNTGKVLEYKDGIVIADGLSEVGYNELVIIKSKNATYKGIALNLEKDKVGIIVLNTNAAIGQGDIIEATGDLLKINASDSLLGKVLNPLGEIIDTIIETSYSTEVREMELDRIAPGVMDRKDVERPIQTGIKPIDTMTPVGRGQRQLIIGDRQTGKTAIAIDTIINQKNSKKPVRCIYVAIGQKTSKVAQIAEILKEAGAMEYTTIVLASASDAASLQYLAAYTGTTIGEYFAEKGEDALIIFDDLTKHAWAYREISLLLRRPPGREAYPGDVFYLHSSILERAVQYSDEKGGGSLTALPIIETQAGDVSAYIPTNVISITDGQIYLETDLFNSGVRPAVNVGLSVSRVGGAAQIRPMKQVAGQLRLDLAQFRELAAFAQFGSDLDEATKLKLERGKRVSKLLEQEQYKPLKTSNQILLIYAGTKGYLDSIDVKRINEWERLFLRHSNAHYSEILERLDNGEKIENEFEEQIKNTIIKFNEEYFI